DQEIVWVRITSEDGFSFLLDKRAVECSGTLRDMVDDSLGFTEAHSKTISLAYRYVSETEPEPEASLTIFGLCCYPVCYYTQLPHCAAPTHLDDYCADYYSGGMTVAKIARDTPLTDLTAGPILIYQLSLLHLASQLPLVPSHGISRPVYSAAVVEKVVEYLNFRYLFKDTTKAQDIPDFSKRIPPEIVLEV
ncbi:unnamed protein product, partial [Rhizoctonia solani]